MRRRLARCLAVSMRRLLHDERAQALPVVALSLMMLLGIAAFAIDTGHARYTYRELQATTDSAALAAARAIPTATTSSQIVGTGGVQTLYASINANGVAAQYSSVTGGLNQRPALQTVSVTSTLECLNSIQAIGIPCLGNVPYNAVKVVQTTVMPTFFAKVLGHPTVTMTTTATAAIRGGSPRPSNIAVIMDTTLSMLSVDTNCVENGVAQTQMQCALNGLQVLLQSLQPCGVNQATCLNAQNVNTNPFDQVALFTFPDLDPGTVSVNTSCTQPVPSYDTWNSTVNAYIVVPPNNAFSGIATADSYQLPVAGASSYSPTGPTYQVTSFLNDFKTSNNATILNTNSLLVKAAGGKSGCGGMAPSNYDGVFGTYYAGVIYAAQAALVHQQSLNPASESILILLSDGDSTAGGQQPEGNSPNAYGPGPNYGDMVYASSATSSGTYPSYYGQCGQAITAAQAATAAGTLVYTVAYGSQSTGCWSDLNSGSHPGISPCDTMYDMASAPQMFYSDYQQSGSGSTCYSSQPVIALKDIFAAIAADLTEARLIPNNTT